MFLAATSDILEAISEAASSHSVGSDIDNEEDPLLVRKISTRWRGAPMIGKVHQMILLETLNAFCHQHLMHCYHTGYHCLQYASKYASSLESDCILLAHILCQSLFIRACHLSLS